MNVVTPCASIVQESMSVDDDKLERLIAGQGRMEGTVESLRHAVEQLTTKVEHIANTQAHNLPKLEAQEIRIGKIEESRSREAPIVRWSDAWRKSVIWGIRTVIIALIGSAAAGQLGWLENLFGSSGHGK